MNSSAQKASRKWPYSGIGSAAAAIMVTVVTALMLLCVKTEPAAFNLAGERKLLDGGSEPSYVAIYEIDSPDVLLSKEWAEAAEKGRWPSEVRPFTSNRRHIVRKVV